MEAYAAQNGMTSPGKHAQALDALPDDVASLLNTVRGLLVHGDYLAFYGLQESDFECRSRETLPLEARLDRILGICAQPLADARPVHRREAGTCRDYAVMACGMLRHKSVPARVRCGFARYLSPGRFVDHWICEYWHAGEAGWARADAQLDDRHYARLGIFFDSSDMPDGEFLSASEAWRLCREGTASPDLFGHGAATGGWFLWVNLARDYLSLKGQELSRWDTWRQAIGREPELAASERESCDDIARRIHEIEQDQSSSGAAIRLQPFWLDRPADAKTA